jgi:LysR family transcriptional regulator, glycine cleavage system transcriptional activator
MFPTSSNLASLRYFEAAARLLSFKQAALELHVTQGAVSQQIKHLEQALRVKLFQRLPRQIKLTEEGQRFAVVVGQALEDIAREASAITATGSTVDIRVRAGPSFALRWLVPRLGDFYAQHPHIKLSITGAYGYFEPSRREFDLAIEMMRGRLPALRSEVLMDEYLVPVCSPAYLAERGYLKKPKDLARCALLHDAHAWIGGHKDAEWKHWLQQAGATEVDSTQGQFFSLANMSIEAALTHQGVAMGRASLIAELLSARQLVAPFKRRVRSPYQYCLLYPSELADRREIRSVIAWLHRQASGSSGSVD